MKTRRMTAVFFTALVASVSVSAFAAPTQEQLDQLSATLKASMGGGMMHGGMMNNESAASKPEPNQKQADASMMQGGMAGNGSAMCATMGSGMMANHMMHGGMMRGSMMGNGMTRGHSMMPQLPPGNEKLQLKMHAEIMQKVGEIIAKYADQVVIGKSDAQ
ncbi:MAG: hypothetical protein ABI228_07365 [Burkholderiaceae bacterium]